MALGGTVYAIGVLPSGIGVYDSVIQKVSGFRFNGDTKANNGLPSTSYLGLAINRDGTKIVVFRRFGFMLMTLGEGSVLQKPSGFYPTEDCMIITLPFLISFQ